jgi:hypothetical protein
LATAVPPVIATPPTLGLDFKPEVIPLATVPTSEVSPTEMVLSQLTDPFVTPLMNNCFLVIFFVEAASKPLFDSSRIQLRRSSILLIN